MNKISFKCSACGKKLSVDHRAAGKRAVCPRCRAKIAIPFGVTAEKSLPPKPEQSGKGVQRQSSRTVSLSNLLFFFAGFAVAALAIISSMVLRVSPRAVSPPLASSDAASLNGTSEPSDSTAQAEEGQKSDEASKAFVADGSAVEKKPDDKRKKVEQVVVAEPSVQQPRETPPADKPAASLSMETITIDLRQPQKLATSENAKVRNEGGGLYYWSPVDRTKPGVITYRFESPSEIEDVVMDDLGIAVWNGSEFPAQDKSAKAIVSVSKDGTTWFDVYSNTSEGGVVLDKGAIKQACGGKEIFVRATLSINGGRFFPSQFMRKNYSNGERCEVVLLGKGSSRSQYDAFLSQKAKEKSQKAKEKADKEQAAEAVFRASLFTIESEGRTVKVTGQDIHKWNVRKKGEATRQILRFDAARQMKFRRSAELLPKVVQTFVAKDAESRKALSKRILEQGHAVQYFEETFLGTAMADTIYYDTSTGQAAYLRDIWTDVFGAAFE